MQSNTSTSKIQLVHENDLPRDFFFLLVLLGGAEDSTATLLRARDEAVGSAYPAAERIFLEAGPEGTGSSSRGRFFEDWIFLAIPRLCFGLTLGAIVTGTGRDKVVESKSRSRRSSKNITLKQARETLQGETSEVESRSAPHIVRTITYKLRKLGFDPKIYCSGSRLGEQAARNSTRSAPRCQKVH